MNKCAKCGAEFEGKFCPECGTAVSSKPVCPRCGNELNEGVKFCSNCGFNLNEQSRSTKKSVAIAVNFNWRKLLQYLPVVLFGLWAVLLWAFFASTVVNGDGLFVDKANLYGMFKDDMMTDLYSSGRALIAFAAIADAYLLVLALVCWKGSRRTRSFFLYASFAMHLAVIVSASVLASDCKSFTENGFEEMQGNLPAVVISLTAVFALLQAGAIALNKFFGEEQSTQSTSQRQRKPVHTPKFIVNTAAWLRAHKSLAAFLSVTIVVVTVLCTVLPVTLGNIFRIGKVSKINLGDTPEQVEEVLGKPYAYSSNERQYNYYSKKAQKKLDELHKLNEQMEELTSLDKLVKLEAQIEKLENDLKLLDYEQITVNFTDDKVSSLTLDKHVGKFEKKKIDKIYLGSQSGSLKKVYTVDLMNVAKDKIDEHIECTDGSYSLSAVSDVTFSNVEFGEYGDSTYPTSAKVSWKNQFGEHSQSVQFDSSNIDFDYSVSNGQLKLSGTILSGSFFKKFGKELPWESYYYTVGSIDSIYFDRTVNFIPDIAELLPDTLTLENIFVDSENQYYSAQEGILFNKDKSECLYVPRQNKSLLDTDWYNDQPDGLIYVGDVLWAYKGTMPTNYQMTIKEGTTEIRANAFENQVNLTSVIMPDSLLTVGERAFYGCESLQKITIPENVTSIGDNAFANCTSLATVNWNAANCKSVGEYERYGDYTIFKSCTNLSTVNIGANVTVIPSHTFYGCSKLTTVNFAYSSLLRTIESEAFYGCESLQKITIPENVTSIGDNAFANCTSLATVNWHATECKSVGSKYNLIFEGCTNLTTVNVGANVTFIPMYAFYNCSSLNRVNITDIDAWCNMDFSNYTDNPLYYAKNLYLNDDLVTEANLNKTTQVGSFAFYGYDKLTKISFPASVTSIGSSAFGGCSNLTIVTFADGSLLQTIGNSAFSGCSSLQEITIPENITSVGNGAFNGCGGLNKVNITDIDAWCNIDFGNEYANPLYYAKNLYLNDDLVTEVNLNKTTQVGSYVFYGYDKLTKISIPTSVTSIGIGAFEECGNLTVVTFANGGMLRAIGNLAFCGCSSLQEITILNNVTSIGYGAFNNCSSLATINFTDGSSMRTIGDFAFCGCSSLQEITIPEKVWYIGSSAFEGCNSLNNVNIMDIDAWCYIAFDDSSANPLYYAKNLYLNGDLVTEVNLVNATRVGSISFYGYDKLTKILINADVTSIGEYAFYNCSNLTAVTFANGSLLQTIGVRAFSDCSSLQNITIPASVTSISSCAFFGCSSLQEITIPAGVTFIGDNLFVDCTNLAMVNWNAINFTFMGEYGSYDNTIFKGCTRLTTVNIGENVASISSYTFYGCNNLTTVIITDGSVLQTIGDYAFYGCSNLQKITIPENVRAVGNSAFADCTNLATVNWNATNCASVGKYEYSSSDRVYHDYTIFNGCTRLATINIGGNVTFIPRYVFYGCSSLQEITIPEKVWSISDCAFYGCSNLTTVIFKGNSNLSNIGSEAFYGCSNLQAVYYGGSQTQWNKINIERYNNTYLTNATRYYYSADKPSSDHGSYWRYVDGKPTVWKEDD